MNTEQKQLPSQKWRSLFAMRIPHGYLILWKSTVLPSHLHALEGCTMDPNEAHKVLMLSKGQKIPSEKLKQWHLKEQQYNSGQPFRITACIGSSYHSLRIQNTETKKSGQYLCPQQVASDDTRELLRGRAPWASNSFIKFCTIYGREWWSQKYKYCK